MGGEEDGEEDDGEEGEGEEREDGGAEFEGEKGGEGGCLAGCGVVRGSFGRHDGEFAEGGWDGARLGFRDFGNRDARCFGCFGVVRRWWKGLVERRDTTRRCWPAAEAGFRIGYG